MQLKASPGELGICALVWIALVLATVALSMPSVGPLTVVDPHNPFWAVVPSGNPARPLVPALDLLPVSLATFGPLVIAAIVIKLGHVTGFGRWAQR